MKARAFELRHFTGNTAANGESDFNGPTSVLSTEQRIEFLRTFAETARRFFGNEQWDRPAVSAEQIAAAVRQLKPQPLPRVRRVQPITHWRWNARCSARTEPDFTFPAQHWRFLLRLRLAEAATVKVGEVLTCRPGSGDVRIEVALDDRCARVNGQLVELAGTGPVDRVTVTGGAVEELWVQSYTDTRAVHGQTPLDMTTVLDWAARTRPEVTGWNQPDCDDAAWPIIEAPFAHGGERFAGPDLYLRHRFRIGGAGRVRLCGETLFHGGEVWVNGQVVAVLNDPRPFTLDLTRHVQRDAENLLAIRVFPFRVEHRIAHGCSDLNSGWFAGRCRIEQTGDVTIEDLFVTTEGDGFRIRAQARSLVWGPEDVHSGMDRRRLHRLRIQVRPWFPADGPVVAQTSVEVPLAYYGRTVSVDAHVPIPDGQWWSPHRPFLYRVDATLLSADGTPLDDVAVTTGLRTVDQAGGVFRLNGRPGLLRGGLLFGMRPPLEDQVRLLRCAPLEHLVREVLLARNCGGNCIRMTIHEGTYLGCNDPRLAEIGDQLGICLLWSTSAWVRTGSPWQIDLDVLAADAKLVRNHPSIVMWQPGNHPRFFDTTDAMAWWREVFHALLAVDDSRLICPAGGLAEPPGDVADEPTWNHPLAARGGFETPTGYAKGWSFLREWPTPKDWEEQFGWTRSANKRELLESPTHAFFDFESEETIGQPNWDLLRNVPPLPANYWQRVGRAGRRHRMAVNICYCRPTSHDRAYYADPPKLLDGRVDPPAFNLSNEIMVAKHVHATVVTRLFQLARPAAGLPEDQRKAMVETLRRMMPRRVTDYLFEREGRVRAERFDLAPLRSLIQDHRDDLLAYVSAAFEQGWPEADREVTRPEALAGHLDAMVDELDAVLGRLRRRLLWAHGELQRLSGIEAEFGALDGEDRAHRRRCERLIQKLKGTQTRQRSEAEGVDEINTYSVLAVEGFLPGYGLDSGSVVGMAEVPYWERGSMDFELPRPTGMALREYVPGNLIYANGHRFVARRFHRDVEQERAEMPRFEVSIEREAIAQSEAGQAVGSMSSTDLRAISVCDVDLVHQSQISDEEETRFQMPVAVYGREQGRHNGGVRYTWGAAELSLRRGVHLRMVNVGATPAIERAQQLGYPLCTVCGQSVSPLASDLQIQKFAEHHEERCGRRPDLIGFYADVVADCLTLPACPDRAEAYSVLEAIRMGAARILDMHLEDLQILVVGHIDRDEVDALLWDPMPGGSGLLDQIRDGFPQVIEAAMDIVANCPARCDQSCIDCLQTFRNAYYHRHLDRHKAIELLQARGGRIDPAHDIPPTHPATPAAKGEGLPVNTAENKLKHLLHAAGFTGQQFQKPIQLDQPVIFEGSKITSTTPDVYFAGDGDDDRGVCIYLDGMSEPLHGNPTTAARDRELRRWLRQEGYEVIEITAVELDDRGAMVRHFRNLARYLLGRDRAREISQDTGWFDQGRADADGPGGREQDV